MTIHNNIDNYLTADLHDELPKKEQNALHAHLVECVSCRQAHQENKIMNKVLEEKFANEKPDAAFEQRMLAGFRNRIPERSGGIAKFFVNLMRSRATQLTAVAAVLLALVQVGRMITGERHALFEERAIEQVRGKVVTLSHNREDQSGEQFAQNPGSTPAFNDRADLKKAQQETGAKPVDTYRKDDITRLGVRAPTDLVTRLPFTAGLQAKPAQAESERAKEKGESTPDNDNESTVAAGAPEPQPTTSPVAPAALGNRKLIRNATVELEVVSFDAAVQKITAFANEERGYIATTSSQRQENGKLKGEIVVKALPENLDRFLQKIRGLGELKNQTLGTEDVTKAYFDTDVRLKNARVMESRLIDMLKKKSDDINDLLQVEKELGRVREQIEQMQGELKFWDSQVQFATVTISLAEKDLEEPAKFLLKERAQLALYTPEVEKIYNDIKALASPKVQITNAQLDRDNSARVSARVSLLIAPEESDGLIAKTKAMGRVENFQVQTERVAQGGEGMSENAKTKRDKAELNITISRDEQEQALQQTSLRIRTSAVDEKTKALRDLADKQSGRVRSSTFSRDPDGREFANVTLRVPMKNYSALMQSLNSLGKLENVSVQRQDRTDRDVDLANAPADLSIQVYRQGNIVSSDTGIIATLRRTIAQSAGAIMWSLRMIGVAIAFLAPWVIALATVIWIKRRIARARR